MLRTFVARPAVLLLGLVLLLQAGEAGAQTRIAFLGLRTRAGVASDYLLAEAGRLVQQHFAAQPGVVLIPAEQVARVIGSPLAIESCQEDSCMSLFAQAVGAQQVVWGYLDRPWPTGYRIWMRVLELPTGSLLREAQPACNPCDETGLLGTLASLGSADLGVGPSPAQQAATAAAAAAASRPTAGSAVLQIPGVHRPLTPEEQGRAGWLTLQTVPPGASLVLFSYKVGETPLNGLQLLPGAYQAVIELEGYQSHAFPLAIRTGQETRLAFRLQPTGVMLRVVSLPIEAQVEVDGRPVGVTPLAAPLLQPGPHRIRVTLPGYLPQELTVQAIAGFPVELTVALQRAPLQEGFLAVKTQPTRASILIDDEPVGQSPIAKRMLAAGEHKVSAYLPGFEQAERVVQLQGGETQHLMLALEPVKQNKTTLTLTSFPAGAEATLGSIRIGKTPIDGIKFKPGRHVLRVMLDGFPPYETMLEVKEGVRTTYHADLSKGSPVGDEGLLLGTGR